MNATGSLESRSAVWISRIALFWWGRREGGGRGFVLRFELSHIMPVRVQWKKHFQVLD
jgi:hypothetical protein